MDTTLELYARGYKQVNNCLVPLPDILLKSVLLAEDTLVASVCERCC